MKNLKDKVVFITGGARGLGYAMAEKFAAEGAKIVIGDIQEALAMEAAEKIQLAGSAHSGNRINLCKRTR